MNHFASPDFWASYRALPAETQALADRSFAHLKSDSHHPSLRLKRVGGYCSVRVGLRYRALGIAVENGVSWFWIGTHAEYDRIVGEPGVQPDSPVRGFYLSCGNAASRLTRTLGRKTPACALYVFAV